MTRKRKRRRKPKAETPLYVPCPQCGGSGEKYPENDDEDGSVYPCVCHNGFIETGFTQERFDALVTRNDKLLIAVADALELLEMEFLSSDTRAAARARLKCVAGTAEELETARSHFRTDE